MTSSYTESSSSSSYDKNKKRAQNKIKPASKSSYKNSLHSVRKHFIAPLPPTPLKTYNVEASNFKEVVRVLTSTPEFQYPSTRRLKDKAPPPLNISKQSLFPKATQPPTPHKPLEGEGMMNPLSNFIMSPDIYDLLNETMQTSTNWSTSSATSGVDYFKCLSPLGHEPTGFSLSPTSLSWCSSVLLSPGTLSTINQTQAL